MNKTICGANCSGCMRKETCKGCVETKGSPIWKSVGMCTRGKTLFWYYCRTGFLVVCTYGENGAGPELVMHKKR